MAINHHGGGGSGGGGGGSNYAVPHGEAVAGGATWHWPFNGSDGGVESITGGAPYDLTGTIYETTGGPGAEMGFIDGARSVNLDTGVIGAAVRIKTAITVAMWIKRIGTNATNVALCGARIAGSGEANNIQWELGYDQATEQVRWIHQDGAADNTNVVNATVSPVLDTWEHWTATRNAAGTIVKLYKNGVLNATSGTLNIATGGTNIDKITFLSNNTGAEFNGYGRTPIVYSSEFDAAGVLALYNSTASTGAW
jgi:hypothetical protein